MTESKPAEGTEEKTEAPKRPRAKHDEAPKPTVARVVHYQLHGNPDPLAAIITAVPEEGDTVSLVIFRTHLQLFRNDVPFSDTPKDGHWSWPPRA